MEAAEPATAPAAEPVHDHAASRRRELDDRIIELHQRNDQLTAAIVLGRMPADGHNARSSRLQVGRAEQLARAARERAAEASRRAVFMYMRAATAHDRAARMHDLLADTGTRDEKSHRVRAVDHRRLATADRSSAELLKSRLG